MQALFFLLVIAAFGKSAPIQSNLSYNFSVPYAGAGTLVINNNGVSSVSITSLSFTINAEISGSPWGNLFPYSATITSNTVGILTTYNILMAQQGVLLGAGSSSSLTYTYNSASGPLGLGMGPSSVEVGLSGSSPSPCPIAGACEGSSCDDPTPGYHSSGYYPSWGMYARQYDAVDIPVQHINQIYYAFIGFDTDGNLHLLDSNSDGKQLPVIASLLQRFPYLHASLSFGGWTLSGAYSQMANNSVSLDNFVSNVMAALQETQFDGVDIDWEYPVLNGAPGEPTNITSQDAEGYTNLLCALREGLDKLAASTGKSRMRLSIAGAGGVDKLEAIAHYYSDSWPRILQAVDVVNVMSYDFHGAFDQGLSPPYDVSDFMSAMETSPADPNFLNSLQSQYNVMAPIDMYLKLGFTTKQISIGIPAYGRLVMVNQIGDTAGLYQTITGTPNGQYDSTGVFDYRCIQERQCHGYQELPQDLVFVDPNTNQLGNMSHTPWGYSDSTSTFLTYDNAQSAQYKVCWAMKQDLYGYMVWDMSGDFQPSDPNSLIGASTGALNGNCA